MAATWELLLHHSYRGTPGVILDESPRRECHGIPVHLDDSAFRVDGAEAGSGAVQFQPNSAVRVPAKPEIWHRDTPIRMEFVCRLDNPTGGMLFGSKNILGLEVRNRAVIAHVLDFGSEAVYSTASAGIEVPTGRWVTVGFDYDGLTELELRVDGRPMHVTRKFAPVTPLEKEFYIGADFLGARVFPGAIDDVKIWRLDRHYIGSNAGARPVKPGVIDCWLEWGKRAREVLSDDPDCAEEVLGLMKSAIRSHQQAALLGGTEARRRAKESGELYRTYWASGDLESVRGALDNLNNSLKDVGLDVANNGDVQNLWESNCFRKLVKILGPPRCDPEFIDIFRVPDGRELS
jgi:hypothetical protein